MIIVLKGVQLLYLDPRNGDILAMVSKPDFNPNTLQTCPQVKNQICGMEPPIKILKNFKTVWRNRAGYTL